MQKYCLPLYLLYRSTSTAAASPSSSSMSSTSFPPNKLYYSFSELQNSTVGYCTDVEGNYEYWKRYLRLSKVLEITENGVHLKPNCYFIYGGDVCDRGVGDLRILQDLVKLKTNYPERVHLILGNRDINKMRLLTELQPESYSQPGETYWTGPFKQTDEFNAPNRLRAILIQSMGAPSTFEYRRQELGELAKSRDIGDDEVVKSFLDSVSPDGVMTQYLAKGTLAVLFGDCLFFHGGLHENTIGYVPPMIDDILLESEMSNISEVKPSSIPPLPLLRWIEELERFKSSEMDDFRHFSSLLSANPPPPLSSVARVKGRNGNDRFYGNDVWAKVGGYKYPAAGGRLLQYGMGWLPDKSVNPTLIYDNYLNDGSPCPPQSGVISYLSQGGVLRVITGHQPHGDAAVVINTERIQFLTGDTSYAKDAKWSCPPHVEESERAAYDSTQESLGRDILAYLSQNVHTLRTEMSLSEDIGENTLFSARPSPSGDPLDTRGVAVSEIYFTFDTSSSSGYVHGVLSNGIPYHFPLPSPVQGNAPRSNLVGLTTSDGWWIKGRLTNSIQDPTPTETEAPPSNSLMSFLSSVFCGCSHKNRPITPQDPLPRELSTAMDECIYLVCYSRGREVFNAFARGKDLLSKGFR